MKTLKLLMIFLAGYLFFLVSCEKDPVESRFKQDEIIVNNNLFLLKKRVNKMHGDHVLPLYPVYFNDDTKSLKSESVSNNYILKLRAEVSSPVYNNVKLQASHIKIVDNYAFVTYNVQGPEYLGGLDIFDVSDISNPALVSNVIFTSRDINSVDVEIVGSENNKYVYLTGAQNIDSDNPGLASPAVIERYLLKSSNNFGYADDPRQFYDLPSFAGNDVRYYNGKVYATSGSSGGLSILTPQMTLEEYRAIPFARSVDVDDVRMAVFSADGGRLHIIGNNNELVIETGGGSYPEAKSMARIKGDMVFAALNDQGMKMYDLNTGNLMGHIPRPVEYEYASVPQNYVSNGVSVVDDLILVANGGSGVYVSQLTENNSIVTIGSMMFEYGSSANFVEASDNKLFVATGLGGLKIIEIVKYDPDTGSLPTDDIDPEPTIICETLYDKIMDMFPDRESIHQGPQSDLIGDIPGVLRLKEKAPVYITFIKDGAGWYNSLGYFAYDASNPPSTVNDLKKSIVFPNTKKYDGSELVTGDRVRIGGPTVEFNENTVIGFFLVAKGWDEVRQMMIPGIYTLYSDKKFNPDNVQKHVMFLEETCNDIVVCFEDQLASWSDEDFDDLMFVVSNGDDEWGNQVNYAFDKETLTRK